MSSFTAPLDVRYHPETDTWTIIRDFEFYSGDNPTKNVIKIKAGEKTDFASIPWFARWLIPKSGKYNQAAVVHDKMCRDFKYDRCKPFYATHKQRCDIFLEAMVVLDVPIWKRKLMYAAVYISGPKANSGGKFYGKS